MPAKSIEHIQTQQDKQGKQLCHMSVPSTATRLHATIQVIQHLGHRCCVLSAQKGCGGHTKPSKKSLDQQATYLRAKHQNSVTAGRKETRDKPTDNKPKKPIRGASA